MAEFTLTREHIQLLRAANVSWEDCEFGAPAIDCKRPYGNSDVLMDMAEILGVDLEEIDDWGEPALSAEQEQELQALHRETEAALQIVLATIEPQPGTYVSNNYGQSWTLTEGSSDD